MATLTDNESSLHRFVARIRRAVRAFESEHTEESSPWTFHVRVYRDELDGGWIAECIDLPGCVSEGDTQQEAIRNLTDAIGEVVAVRMGNHVQDFGPDDGSSNRELALTV